MSNVFGAMRRSPMRALRPIVVGLLLGALAEQSGAQARGGDVLPVRVIDTVGKPVKGATIAGRYRPFDPIQLFGVTDDAGAINLELEADTGYLRLYARAEGHALVDHSLSLERLGDQKEVLTLGLPAVARISGRLVDEQGEAASGVRVRPYKIIKFEGRKSLPVSLAESEWIRDLEEEGWPLLEVQRSSEALLPWVETDPEGKFTIEGIAPGQLVGLMAISERTAATTILVRTDEGEAVSIGTERGDPKITIHPREGFEQVVGKSVPVVGTVVDLRPVGHGNRGKPVFGATISPWRAPVFGFYGAEKLLEAKTNLFGQYRLIGMPVGEWRVYCAPPEDRPMVAVERRVEVGQDDELVTVDYTMPEGVTVRGRVTDLETGEPVPGTIESYVFSDNPRLKQFRPSELSTDRHSAGADAEGKFEIQVLPGPGILTFMASTTVPQNYRRGIGWNKIDHHIYEANGNRTLFKTAPSLLIAYNCTQLYAVDVPEVGPYEIDLVVGEKRTDVPLAFTREDGTAVSSSVYYSNATPDDKSFRLWSRNSSRERWEEAVVSFFDGDKRRVVQANDSDLELAGWAWVGPDDESATIELKPAASVRGRVVRADGSPVVGALLATPYSYDPTEKAGVLPSQPKEGYYPHTDAEGRFEFIGLPAGLPLTVMIDQKDEARSMLLARHYLFEGLELEAGESRDLGELRIDELREWKYQK